MYGSRMRASAASVAFVWLVAQPEYQSCACNELPDESRPLPIGELECDDDLDCTSDACEVGMCWAGACMFRAVIDRDADGAFPAPCGDDCNDIDDTVGPGATEFCDAADDDCDGAIDEGASATNAYLITSAAPSPTSLFLPSDGSALLVHSGASDRDFVAHRFGPVRALEPARAVGSFDTGVLAGARGNDGVYAVVVYAGTAQYALFDWAASEITVVRPPATVPGLEVGATSAFDVIAFGDTVAIAYDAGTRNVRIGIEGPDVPIGDVVSPSAVSLATDGTHR